MAHKNKKTVKPNSTTAQNLFANMTNPALLATPAGQILSSMGPKGSQLQASQPKPTPAPVVAAKPASPKAQPAKASQPKPQVKPTPAPVAAPTITPTQAAKLAAKAAKAQALAQAAAKKMAAQILRQQKLDDEAAAKAQAQAAKVQARIDKDAVMNAQDEATKNWKPVFSHADYLTAAMFYENGFSDFDYWTSDVWHKPTAVVIVEELNVVTGQTMKAARMQLNGYAADKVKLHAEMIAAFGAFIAADPARNQGKPEAIWLTDLTSKYGFPYLQADKMISPVAKLPAASTMAAPAPVVAAAGQPVSQPAKPSPAPMAAPTMAAPTPALKTAKGLPAPKSPKVKP